MTFLTTLLPGLREIRAPLAGGYLWILLIWLIADPDKPMPGGDRPYDRLGDLAEAVGPIGVGVAGSVAAFLIGSLAVAVVRRSLDFIRERRRRHLEYNSYLLRWDRPKEWVPLDAIRSIAGLESPPEYLRETAADGALASAMRGLASRELGSQWRNLEAGIKASEDREGEAAFELTVHESEVPVAVLQIPSDRAGSGPALERREYEIPRFSPQRDLLSDLSLILTRLVEWAPVTGTKIERLYSEAEFRLAIAVPLSGLLLFFFATTSLWWFLGLLLPAALILQGLSLEREGGLELVDALRARGGTEEVEKITPIFKRYRELAEALSEALRQADFSTAEPALPVLSSEPRATAS